MVDHFLRQRPPSNEGKALTRTNYHTSNGVLNFKALGYSDKEIKKLTNPKIYFDKLVKKQKEEW